MSTTNTASDAATSAAAAAPSTGPPHADAHSNRVDVINTAGGRILCIADIRGSISSLNTLATEHSAVAILHRGDFGFYEPSSLGSISDRTLRHLIQYSSLISSQFRSQLLAPNTTPAQMRELLADTSKHFYPPSVPPSEPYFGLSEFPRLLSGDIQLNVPVYTVWGACEDVAILEKIRAAAPSEQSVPTDPTKAPAPASAKPTKVPGYSIPNLTVLDEATTRVLDVGGLRLRLFGLGGAVVQHKLFDNGTGSATIAGGGGTMWTTMLQIGELVDTAQKVYDASETRLLLTHASPGREGLLAQLALVLKADLTVSAGLHFRYGISYNEFVVHHDVESFRGKLEASKRSFTEVWDTVKSQVEAVVDDNQKLLLENALAVANRSVPPPAEEAAYKNTWHWNLPDASYGSLVLDVREGRIGSELKSQGFNFAYRANPKSNAPQPSKAPMAPRFTSGPQSSAPPRKQPMSQQQQPGAPDTATGSPHGRSSPFSNAPGAGYPRGSPRGPAGSSFHMRAPSGPGTGPRGGGGRFGGGWGRDAASAESPKAESPSASPAPGATSVAAPSVASATAPATATTESARASATAVTAEAATAATVPVPGEGEGKPAAAALVEGGRPSTASPAPTTNSGRQSSRPYRQDRPPRQNREYVAANGQAPAEGGTTGPTTAEDGVSSPTSGTPGDRSSRGRGRGRGGRGGGPGFPPRGRGGRGGRGGGPGGEASAGGEGDSRGPSDRRTIADAPKSWGGAGAGNNNGNASSAAPKPAEKW